MRILFVVVVYANRTRKKCAAFPGKPTKSSYCTRVEVQTRAAGDDDHGRTKQLRDLPPILDSWWQCWLGLALVNFPHHDGAIDRRVRRFRHMAARTQAKKPKDQKVMQQDQLPCY